MSDINFQFLQRSGALPYSMTKANALNNWQEEATSECAIEDILFRPYSKGVWRPDEIKRYLNLLTP